MQNFSHNHTKWIFWLYPSPKRLSTPSLARRSGVFNGWSDSFVKNTRPLSAKFDKSAIHPPSANAVDSLDVAGRVNEHGGIAFFFVAYLSKSKI
jgi:hypothetical protein